MEAGVEGLIRAGRFERSADRATWRNGYRERSLDTLNLTVPKLSAGAYFPGFLEPRRLSASPTSLRGIGLGPMVEKALVSVIQGRAAPRIDGIAGVGTRRIDALVQALPGLLARCMSWDG
jgi:putative transposase